MNMRKRLNLDFGWRFSLGDISAAKDELFDDTGWRMLDLPHDWSIEGAYDESNPMGSRGGYLPAGIGWYRKTLHVPCEWLGKRLYLEFDGIYMNSDVWINGRHLGNRPYGYIGFEYDLTGYLHTGANVISVRVDCSKQPSSRWYNGSGIYRHTWLTVTDQIHVAHWGTYVTTPSVNESCAKVRICTTVCNRNMPEEKSFSAENGAAGTVTDITAAVESINVRSVIINAMGETCSAIEMGLQVGAGSEAEAVQEAMVSNPGLWSPENPVLYTVRTEIIKNGQIIDDYVTSFGIRHFEFTSDKGFVLNGVPMKFKGVCNHHDAGPVGAAVPDAVLEKRLHLLKEMGCNAIRTSHNPFSPEFYDMCDRIGLMVMDEAFDGWEHTKAPCDYGLYFEEWWQRDLKDLILRDRNHPCVILWSIGNEVHSIKAEYTRMLRDFVHGIDPARPVTCGVQGTSDNADKNRAELDVAGYNDGGGACFVYKRDHERRPEQCFIATESPHTLQTRGFYRTQTWWRDKNLPRKEIPNLTVEEIFFDGDINYSSSYDNCGVRVCARDTWDITQSYSYLCGEFRWTGFDYLGETRGWPTRMKDNGVIDLANLKKDHFYLYQSMWTDAPMIHLLPHWTHPGMEGSVIPVWVYTTCEEAELLLNGKSLGKQEKGNKRNLSWDVPYQPGEIRAVGLISGKAVVEKSLYTASGPEKIRLIPDKNGLNADGRDVVQITFVITDMFDNPVPRAGDAVKYIVKGPCKLLGMENGDQLDLTPSKADWRKAFYGMGMGLVQSTQEDGDIELIAAGILGEKVFRDSTRVAVAVSSVAVRGTPKHKDMDIYYTVDGSTPNRESARYGTPFEINCSTVVKAAFYEDGVRLAELEARFMKGERPKVIDLAHGNREPKLDRPAGPFALQLQGEWTDGQYIFDYKPDGEVYRRLGDELVQKLGCWWYDFPVDFLEAQDYAGTGEVWFSTGEKRKMALTTQEAKELVLNTEGVFKTAWGDTKQLKLHRR